MKGKLYPPQMTVSGAGNGSESRTVTDALNVMAFVKFDVVQSGGQ